MKVIAKKKLSEAEQEIMLIIWRAEGEVTSEYIMEKLEGKKVWAKTTVLNFLIRLVEKKYITCEKRSKINYYTPIAKEDEYLAQESSSFFEKMHRSSLTNLVATLYNSNSVTQKDLNDLRKFIEEADYNG